MRLRGALLPCILYACVFFYICWRQFLCLQLLELNILIENCIFCLDAADVLIFSFTFHFYITKLFLWQHYSFVVNKSKAPQGELKCSDLKSNGKKRERQLLFVTIFITKKIENTGKIRFQYVKLCITKRTLFTKCCGCHMGIGTLITKEMSSNSYLAPIFNVSFFLLQ